MAAGPAMNPAELAPLFIGSDGWCVKAHHIISPNFDARPADAKPELLVIHSISLPPGELGGPAIVQFFTNRLDWNLHPYYESLRDLRVSAHFLVRGNGVLIQFVSCLDRAWHAGVSSFEGRERCNDFSIGIELEGTDDRPFLEPQYVTLARLTRGLVARFPLFAVAAHSEISPSRKSDPGPGVDWPRFSSGGGANLRRIRSEA